MRRSVVLGFLAAGVVTADLHAQRWVLDVAAGLGGDGAALGPALRVMIAQPTGRSLAVGLDLAYVGGAAADTGSVCGVAGCFRESGRVGGGAIQVGTPVLLWNPGGLGGLVVRFAPFVGRWMSCSPPESRVCARRPVLDAGVAVALGLGTVVRGHRWGIELRYAKGIAATLELGGAEAAVTRVRPAVVAVLVTVGTK